MDFLNVEAEEESGSGSGSDSDEEIPKKKPKVAVESSSEASEDEEEDGTFFFQTANLHKSSFFCNLHVNIYYFFAYWLTDICEVFFL